MEKRQLMRKAGQWEGRMMGRRANQEAGMVEMGSKNETDRKWEISGK